MLSAYIIFAGSLVGLAGLFWLKLWENSRGRRTLENPRAKLDKIARKTKWEFSGRVPEVKSETFLRLLHTISHDIAVLLHKMVRGAERRLARGVHLTRGKKEKFERKETSSEFLKNVAEHKRNLELPPHKPVE